jgi:multidrug resistance efflux pump
LSLYREGAFPQVTLDSAEIDLTQRQSKVKSLQAQIQSVQANKRSIQANSEGIQANIDAIRSNLTLSRTRSNYDPSVRKQELEAQIQGQQQGIEVLTRQKQALQTELNQLQSEITRKEKFTVEAPSSGMVWKLNVQQGTQVRAGESLGQIANCDNLWVDAWVEEEKLQSIKPGKQATITYKGGSGPIKGTIEWIRSGIARPATGSDAVGFLDPNQSRRAQVRINLDPSSQRSDCEIGYYAQVSLETSKEIQQSTPPAWLKGFWPR